MSALITPNAQLVGYARKTGATGTGAPALAAVDAISAALPVPCALAEPSNSEAQSLTARGVERGRTVVVDGAWLEIQDIDPSVGDRLVVREEGDAAREQTLAVVMVKRNPTAALAGALRDVRLVCAVVA